VIRERCAVLPVWLANALIGSIETWLTQEMQDDLARLSKKGDEIGVRR
jgi:hypothetical protein